jgi:hypothetical protein
VAIGRGNLRKLLEFLGDGVHGIDLLALLGEVRTALMIAEARTSSVLNETTNYN